MRIKQHIGLFSLLLIAGPQVLQAQLTLVHQFTSSSFITVQDENTESPDVDYFATESNLAGATSGERIQLNFSDIYSFQEVSVTNGWDFVDQPDGSSSITRTYYFGGLDGGVSGEKYYFDTPFQLNFTLSKTDPGQTQSTHSLNYVVISRIDTGEGVLATGGPSGTFETTLIDPYAIPEPSTYALIIGGVVLLPVLWLRMKKKREPLPTKKSS